MGKLIENHANLKNITLQIIEADRLEHAEVSLMFCDLMSRCKIPF